MNVLVVGAGLAGMVLATALKRAGIDVDVIEVHPTWQVLGVGISVQGPALADLLVTSLPVEQTLARFMQRRYERCRIVVQNSWQLGEWKKTPHAPGADPTALIQASVKALAAPI